MPLHDAANGSVPPFLRDCARAPAAQRAIAALAALALAAGCATGVPPAARRSADEAAARTAAEIAAREASGFVGLFGVRPTDGPARAITLQLRNDGTAELTTVALGRAVERTPGRWGVSGGALRLEWDPTDPSRAAPLPTTWLRAEDGRLVPAVEPPPTPVPADPLAAAPALTVAEGPLLSRWEPSRAAHPGCTWRPFADATLAVLLLVESCGNGGPRFAARGAEIVDTADASGAARGTPIVQVFAKDPKQPLPDAIRKRFFPQLVPRVRAGCVVRKGGGADLGDPAKETWTIGPTAKYQGETAKWRAAEPTAMVCGPYGERDGVGYFEFHPAESPGRYLYVWLGQGAPRFDERSIELLD